MVIQGNTIVAFSKDATGGMLKYSVYREGEIKIPLIISNCKKVVNWYHNGISEL